MELLIFSDLHIHNYKRFSTENSRLYNTLDVLDKVFAVASNRNIKSILFCGDLFDKQKSIPTVVINETVDRFQSLFNMHPEISMYCITGNHDLGTRTSLEEGYVSSLQHLDTVFPRLKVIDFGYVYLSEEIIVSGIPYLQSRTEFSEALERVHKHTNILLVHQTPDQFMDGELDVKDKRFKKFDHVFSGHIHQFKQYTDNFTMVGSPLHRDLGDEDNEKFILIYDTENKSIEQLSTQGMYPEFKRGKDEDDGNYWIEPMVDNIEVDVLDYEFSTLMSPEELVTNYYNQLQLEDKELLNIGIKCVK